LGLALVAGWIVLIATETAHAHWLLRHGRRVYGTVTQYDTTFRGGGHIVVTYTVQGIPHRATIALTGTSPPYAIGGHVLVIYNPRDPTDIRTLREDNLNAGTALPIIGLVVGIILAAIGSVIQRRAWRMRRILSSGTWLSYQRVTPPPIPTKGLAAMSVLWFSRSEGETSPVRFRVAAGTSWKLSRARGLATAWIATDDRRAVLTSPQTGELFLSRVWPTDVGS
jgi:hypothetical protein